jgi:hypothetical protein
VDLDPGDLRGLAHRSYSSSRQPPPTLVRSGSRHIGNRQCDFSRLCLLWAGQLQRRY